jgi:toluene monooxygenase system protein E
MNSAQPGLKTWSTFSGTRRKPSEYEVVSVDLHSRTRNPEAAYELAPSLFMNAWYRQHVGGSVLQHPHWDGFRDPDELIYRRYTVAQDGHEDYVDGLLSEHAREQHDQKLEAPWRTFLRRFYTPARYPLHAIQMSSAYMVQMAPGSTITNAAVFQEADAYRWLSRVAYRTRELQIAYPDEGFGAERASWEDDPLWQPWREMFEKVLATYDWGEHLFAMNAVAKLAFDEAFCRAIKPAARAVGDTLLAMLLDAQLEDVERSRRWTRALAGHALEHAPNRAALKGILERWMPLAERAVWSWCAALPEGGESADAVLERIRVWQAAAGLT